MFRKLGLLVLSFLLLAGATGCKKEEKDPLLAKVDLAIDAFVSDQLTKFISTDDKVVLDYYVIPAIKALEDNGYDIKLNELVDMNKVNTYYADYDYSTVGDIFKATVIRKAFNLNLDTAKIKLTEITEVDVWSYTNGLMALNITGVNNTLKQELLTKINVFTEDDYRDADYAGVALMASANSDIDKNPLYNLINTSLSKDGVVTWGEANSSSTANVILGLIANGINPTNEEYTTNGVNLVEALLLYQTDGAFKNKLNGEVDLTFATPQAFSALVAYKLFVKNQKFNLFN